MFTSFFFFNDTATTEIYTLSLHDALPICLRRRALLVAGAEGALLELLRSRRRDRPACRTGPPPARGREHDRSEEHTSELQSRLHLVCRLLLAKKKPDTSSHYRANRSTA